MLESVYNSYFHPRPKLSNLSCPQGDQSWISTYVSTFSDQLQADILLVEKCNVLCEISLNPYCILHFLRGGLSMFIPFH